MISTNAGPPFPSNLVPYVNYTSIIDATCSNAALINKNQDEGKHSRPSEILIYLASFFFSLISHYNGNSSPKNYSFFSVNYEQTSISQLESSPLGVAGSISGAWAGFLAIFGTLYTLILMKFPPPLETGKISPEPTSSNISEIKEKEQVPRIVNADFKINYITKEKGVSQNTKTSIKNSAPMGNKENEWDDPVDDMSINLESVSFKKKVQKNTY